MEQERFHLTDMGNAERFQHIYGNRLRYLKEAGRFFQFDDNTGWAEAPDKFNLTKAVIRDMHLEAAECRDDGYRVDLAKHARDTESTTSQRNMLALAEDYLAVHLKDFDANPRLINCRNGVVNLRDKTIAGHSPEHLHLNQANASYSGAKCPRWLKFLDEIFDGDDALKDWMQVALGYSTLGLTNEHCFFLCYGAGRNGKGVLLETIGHVLGSYSDNCRFDTFLQKDGTNTRTLEAIGKLKGKRFIVSSEVNEGTRFDAARVKELTGGDTIVGTALYRSTFKFTPTHTLWLACNHLPEIRDNTFAMWSRVKLIPFQRVFSETEQQKNLSEALKSEADGIFSWLIDGAYRYLKDGLPEEPEACKQATQAYRDIGDKLSIFIRERLEKDKSAVTPQSDIYSEYTDWHNGDDVPISKKMFGKELENRGLTRKDKNYGMAVMGYSIKGGGSGEKN